MGLVVSLNGGFRGTRLEDKPRSSCQFPHARHAQILETKDEAVKDGLYEEAALLMRREGNLRWLGSPVHVAP